MPLSLNIAGITDIGQVRRRNEDSIGLEPGLGIVVVADGMGGHPGGDVASSEAAVTAVHRLREFREGSGPQGGEAPMDEAMRGAVMAAHAAVRARGEDDPELEGMGTTVTAFAADPDEGSWSIGHVGDSRAYLLRHGSFRQLTRDDTWVQQRVDAAELTPEQARRHPFGHILTQCVGLEDPPTPQILSGRLERGDVFLLCTDGLAGMLDDEFIADALRAHFSPGPDAEGAVDALVAGAKDRGGYDNITVAIISVG